MANGKGFTINGRPINVAINDMVQAGRGLDPGRGGNNVMAALMGFEGMPHWSRFENGGMGGRVWPASMPNGHPYQPPGSNPPTGGNDPGANPPPPVDPLVKAGLPPWYVDWLHTSGQYGGVPPIGGLLD